MSKATTFAALTQEQETSSPKPQNDFTNFPFISHAIPGTELPKIEFEAAKQVNETTASTISNGEQNVRLHVASNIGSSILIMLFIIFY